MIASKAGLPEPTERRVTLMSGRQESDTLVVDAGHRGANVG
jgi:hypothetical protein